MKVTEYLEWLTKTLEGRQSEYFKWILDNGTSFSDTTLIPGNIIEPQIKECYRNSILLSYSTGLDYYEGYYVTEIGVPLEHAFNFNPDKNEAIDITSQYFGFQVQEWFGLKVPKEYLDDWINTNQVMTPLQFYFRRLNS